MYKIFHPWFSFQFFFCFMEIKPPVKVYGVFDNVSRIYKVKKFSTIKLYLSVSYAIHANKHMQYANCGLHVNFWNFLLMPFCFMMKKDHFE